MEVEVKKIAIAEISYPEKDGALRPAPAEGDKDYDKYLEFREDVKNRGITNIFSVRKVDDGYEVVDGSRRFTAVKDLYESGEAYEDGMITVKVSELDDMESLATQISANYHVKQTMKTQEIASLKRVALVKGWSMKEIANYVGMSEMYVGQLFKVTQLPEDIQVEIDAGNVSLANAIKLSSLPFDVLGDYLEQAKSQTGAEFTATVAQAKELIKKERQEVGGTSGKNSEFTPKDSYMKKSDAQELLEQAKAAYGMDDSEYNRGALESLLKIFKLDEASISEQKAEWEEKKAKQASEKENRKAAREAKALADAEKLLKEAGRI